MKKTVKKPFAVFDRKTRKFVMRMNATSPQKVVRHYANKMCKKSKKVCTMMVYIFNGNTGLLKGYKYTSRKIKPKTITLKNKQFKVRRSKKITYTNSFHLLQ